MLTDKQNLNMIIYVSGFFLTLFACLIIVKTKYWHGKFTLDQNSGVQKFHKSPTPRVGGIALFLGLIFFFIISKSEEQRIIGKMLLASIPAYSLGTLEDLTKKVSVQSRLLATIFSGLLIWWLTGVTVNHVDLLGFDYLLKFLPVSVVFTAIAIAGFSNSINIIDGFNGLASGILLICLSSLAIIALQTNDLVMMNICLMLASVLLGFFTINYPLGKIFLGDGGAYLYGFLVSSSAVMIIYRNINVSPWAIVLACSYPIVEILYSIIRRYKRKVSPGHPDRLHMHSIIRSRIIRKYFRDKSELTKNYLVSPIVWLLALIPSICAAIFYNDSKKLIILFVLYFILYSTVYKIIIKIKR